MKRENLIEIVVVKITVTEIVVHESISSTF